MKAHRPKWDARVGNADRASPLAKCNSCPRSVLPGWSKAWRAGCKDARCGHTSNCRMQSHAAARAA
eukprot:12821425-Alexandrium_andersonii.AAC.1